MAYLLGLLAMIKCSICSYQCDNWYVSNWRLACHINFCLGRCSLELAQRPLCVALAWHFARRSTPFGVTFNENVAYGHICNCPSRMNTICRLTHVSHIYSWMCGPAHHLVSQRSLHNAPIFRLLLKVAVNGTHQCDFLNFCGGFGSQQYQVCIRFALGLH